MKAHRLESFDKLSKILTGLYLAFDHFYLFYRELLYRLV